jgi:hypothetical protein
MPYTRITSKNIEDNTVDTVDIKNGAVTVDKINIDKDLSVNGHRITGLADPVDNSDVATKSYVDAHTSNQLPPATSGQTLRYDGTAWVADSNLYNDGTNIGIGTTSPSEKLHVAGNIGISAGANAFIGTKDNYALSLRTNNTDRIFIDASGNVGIGTNNPQQKLDVKGSLNLGGHLIMPTGGYTIKLTGNNSGIAIIGGDASYTGSNIRLFGYQHPDTPNIISFYRSNGSQSIEEARFDGNGNLGIGTTSPSEKLDVVGNVKLSGNLLIGDGTAGNKTIIANNADTNKPQIRYNDTSKKWEFTNDGTTWKSISDEIVYYEDTFTGDGTTKTFTLSNTPILSSVFVIRNGIVLKSGVDYTISSNTITFTEAPANGSLITVKYNKTIPTTSEVVNQFLGNNNTWSGINTFINDVNANNIKVSGYIKQEFPTSNLSATGTIITITAGENLSAGDVLKIGVDGKYYKANASYSSGVPAVALAIENINVNSTGRALVKGYWLDTSKNYIVGGDLYLSTTAGDITQTPPTSDGNQIQKLGIALTNNLIEFNPDQTYMEYKAIPYRVDLTSAITDYLLQVGEEAYIAFSNATSVPLHINIPQNSATAYQITLFVDPISASNFDLILMPNNTSYSNAFRSWSITQGGNNSGTYNYFFFDLLNGTSDSSPYIINMIVNNYPLGHYKIVNVFGGSFNTNFIDTSVWVDASTSWTSLGSITSLNGQQLTGFVLIRRLQ